MIFICVGSREYQFDRLIKKVDQLVEQEMISNVFGQIGTSTYTPKKFEYERFLSSDDFESCQKKADIIITHGGTGALISSLKLKKQVISVPRLSEYGEHTDNHQLQVSSVLDEMGYLKMVTNISNLDKAVLELTKNPINKTYNRPSNVLNIVDEFIVNSF